MKVCQDNYKKSWVFARDDTGMSVSMESRPVELILENNLLIKSNKGRDLIIDYNQSSDGLFQICIKCLIGFRILVIV